MIIWLLFASLIPFPVRTSSTLSFLCSWSYGVVVYEIFTVGKLAIVIIYDRVEAHCPRLVGPPCTLKLSPQQWPLFTRREAGEREKDIRLLLFLFGYPLGLLRRKGHLT